MREAINFLCKNILHRMWWVPLWNRSVFLCCPIAWLCYRNDRFDAWYYGPGQPTCEPQ